MVFRDCQDWIRFQFQSRGNLARSPRLGQKGMLPAVACGQSFGRRPVQVRRLATKEIGGALASVGGSLTNRILARIEIVNSRSPSRAVPQRCTGITRSMEPMAVASALVRWNAGMRFCSTPTRIFMNHKHYKLV
jgi:hypothetical protein